MVNPIDVLYKTRVVQPKEQRKQIEEQKKDPTPPASPPSVNQQIRQMTTGNPSGRTNITEQVINKTQKEDIASIPVVQDDYRSSPRIQESIDVLGSHGINPETFKDYEYVTVGDRSFYSRDPYAYNALVDYVTKSGYQSEVFFEKVERKQYEDTGIVPDYVKRQINFDEGSMFKPLEADFERIAYEQHLGIISEEDATKRYTDVYYNMYPIKPVESPRERDVWNIGDWTEDFWGTAGGLAADVFMPMPDRIKHTLSSLQDSGDNTLFSGSGTQEMKDLWRQNRQSYRNLWDKGDFVGGAGRIISSPFPLATISYGAGVLFSGAFSLVGASGAPGSVAFATYGPTVAGVTVSGVVGADIGYTAALEEKKLLPEGSTIGKIGTYTTAAYSAYLGSQYISRPDVQTNFKNSFSNVKSTYGNVKEFALDKMPTVKSGLDKAYWTTYKKGLIPGSYGRQIDYRLTQWSDARYFQSVRNASITFGKSKPYIGLYEQGELINIMGTGRFPMRPENINIMPHNTRTEFFVTEKGTIEFTSQVVYPKDNVLMRFGESSPDMWSSGEIFPEFGKSFSSNQFGTGKKGGNLFDFLGSSKDTEFFVSGKTYYKSFADEGPLATIPSVRDRVFYGTVSSQELKIPSGSSIGSDWAASKVSGSFSFGGKPPSPDFFVNNPGKIYKFQNRLVNETLYTESISFTKSFEGGSVTKPGRWGLETVDTPRFDISYTRSYIPTVSEDYAVTRFPMLKDGKGFLPDISGFDLSVHEGSNITDLVMPGGISSDVSGLKFPKPTYAQVRHPNLVTRTPSLSYLEYLESGIGNTSSFWKSSIPTSAIVVKPNIKSDINIGSRKLSNILNVNVSPISISSINLGINTANRNLNRSIVDLDVVSKVDTRLLSKQNVRVDTKTVTIQDLLVVNPSITIPTPRPIVPSPKITRTTPIIEEIIEPTPVIPPLLDFEVPGFDVDLFGSGFISPKQGGRKRMHPVRLINKNILGGRRLI